VPQCGAVRAATVGVAVTFPAGVVADEVAPVAGVAPAAVGFRPVAVAILGAVVPPGDGDMHESLLTQVVRWWRHRWMDERAAERAVPPALAEQLQARVSASEARHSGEIVLCVEAALPNSYLWRVGSETPLPAVIRERALSWFGKQRVWDTEHNNGVLIYLLLAERRVEIVADRGISRHVPDAHWQVVVQKLSEYLQAGDFDSGLTQALQEVSALLVQNFPLQSGEANPNELCNRVVWA
jgi:uncharacterized membrane protein